MSELINTTDNKDLLLANLANEARLYSEGIMRNSLQLGRVFIDAKKVVKHGEWETWVKENSGVSIRTAQNLMAAYARFANMNNPSLFQGIEKAKLFKMLSLPEGTEEEFAANNDIAAMTAREVEEAVKRTREENKAEIEREKQARLAAEQRAAELESRPPEIPQEVTDALRSKDDQIAKQQEQIDDLSSASRGNFEELKRLRSENASLQRDLRENEEMLQETQRDCERAQMELLDMKSAAARGDAERIPDDSLTIENFSSAVRQFMGTCARMPHMAIAFSTMTLAERERYNELLSTIEGWAQGSRKALSTIDASDSVVIGS